MFVLAMKTWPSTVVVPLAASSVFKATVCGFESVPDASLSAL